MKKADLKKAFVDLRESRSWDGINHVCIKVKLCGDVYVGTVTAATPSGRYEKAWAEEELRKMGYEACWKRL